MNLFQLISATEMGLIFSLVALGTFISFKVLNFPDMTVDGSFPMGGAVAATMLVKGGDPFVATLAAMACGFMVGFITAWISTHLKISNLLAGIITMTALYSVNLRIMGQPNISLISEQTMIDKLQSMLAINIPALGSVLPLFAIAVIFMFLLYRFFKSQIGLAMRAAGSNPRMGRAQGINDHHMVWLGLGMSNAMVALGGALFAQVSGFADATMGVGTITIGLAAVIIGQSILPNRNIFQALVASVVGAIIYRLVLAVALNINGLGLQASDLNLVTALIVVLSMLLPNMKVSIKHYVADFFKGNNKNVKDQMDNSGKGQDQ